MPSRLPAAERRKQLLDVAMTVFSDHGFHGASMNDVATAAGVTKPVLYQHFPSKRELYLELVEGVSSQLAETVTTAARTESDALNQAQAALTAYFRFVEETREIGIEVPIVPGLLPIQSLPQIEKLAGMCGAKIPEELRQRLAAGGEDADAVRQAGIDWCIEQSRALLARGAPGIHYYVLNRASNMEAIFEAL